MDKFYFWRFHNDFSVVEAALLIIDCDPVEYRDFGGVENWTDQQPENFLVVFESLKRDVIKKRIPSSTCYEAYGIGTHHPTMKPDWNETTLSFKDIQDWLKNRGHTTGFFFSQTTNSTIPEYLNYEHKNFAPKLAAAIDAWLTITNDPERLTGKTPKQALIKRLNEKADLYGLTKNDGTPNGDGIEQIAKIANWKPGGGVAKTPLK